MFHYLQINPKFRSTTTAIPDFDDFDSSPGIVVSTPRTSIGSVTVTSQQPTVFVVSTPKSSIDSGYDPCAIPDACGPNAICTPKNNDPICSCPEGFSGIPRDGVPDPAHGCVRTPQKCGANSGFNNTCPAAQSCVRDLCLPDCSDDSQCSLGERCVSGNCIKICFYDAHCLAGEFCDKTGNPASPHSGLPGSGNGVCLSGCRRDTNCPFGQICMGADEESGSRGQCEQGCHFNNDCTMKTACIDGHCGDPCIGFDECGSNAICETVSHAPTCKCPENHRELNSPYVACVPEHMDLASISCLRDSDCSFGLQCKDWQCREAPPVR